MKKRLLLLILFLTFGLLTACAGGNQTENADHNGYQEAEQRENKNVAFPVTVKDARGSEVVVEEKPERIVSLIPSNTETAFALGLEKEIVGVSDHDNYPEEVEEKERVGGMELNIEKIISLKPDLVLASEINPQEGLQQLEDAGITVLVVNDAANFSDAYDSIKMIGEATGKLDEAEKIVQGIKNKIKEIQDQIGTDAEKKKVYVEVWPAPDISVAGKNTFIDEMLQLIGAENIIKKEGWPKVDQEAVIEADPDVIITTYGAYAGSDSDKEIPERDGWQDVTAVKNKQIYDVDNDTVTRPGPRLAEGIEEIAKAVYPEIFE